MPTINIPPVVRFVLYLIGSIALLTVSYAVDKDWAGDAEVRYVTGLAGLLFVLAAAKTTLSDTAATVTGTVVSETGETGEIEATIGPAPEVEKHILGKALYADSEPTVEQPGGMRARDYGDGDPHRTH